jgi:hypothetical protein
MNAQTSDRISSIAARYTDISPETLFGMTATEEGRRETCRDIKSMAASLLRQDEVRGLRKFVRKLVGV